MIDDIVIEARLRRTFDEIAKHAELIDLVPTRIAEPRRPRPSRRISRRILATASLAAVVAVALVAVGVHRDPHRLDRRVNVATEPSTTIASITTTLPILPPKPAAITGTEQTIASATQHVGITDIFGTGPAQKQLVAGTTPESLSVDRATPFVVADVAYDPLKLPGEKFPSACSYYMGTLAIGGEGIGIELECVPLDAIHAGTKHLATMLPSFPRPPFDTWIWAHLPSGTAFVTFSFPGVAQLWERPSGGVAGFAVATPKQFRGPPDYEDDGAPVPTMRALDAHGNLLEQIVAPRYPCDLASTDGGC